MTWERAEAVTRASQLATVFSSLKNLGLTDRGLLNEIMRGVLEANPRLLGVWTVWEHALNGLDTVFAGAPGMIRRPLRASGITMAVHSAGGHIDYDKPDADWRDPTRRKAEVVIDP
jgi:hypothetical protein